MHPSQTPKFRNIVHTYFLKSDCEFLPGNLVALEKTKGAKSGVNSYGVNISKPDFFPP